MISTFLLGTFLNSAESFVSSTMATLLTKHTNTTSTSKHILSLLSCFGFFVLFKKIDGNTVHRPIFLDSIIFLCLCVCTIVLIIVGLGDFLTLFFHGCGYVIHTCLEVFNEGCMCMSTHVWRCAYVYDQRLILKIILGWFCALFIEAESQSNPKLTDMGNLASFLWWLWVSAIWSCNFTGQLQSSLDSYIRSGDPNSQSSHLPSKCFNHWAFS